MGMTFDYLSRFFAKETDDRRNALLVDGPNLLRDEFDVRFEEVREVAERDRKLNVARVYLNHRAPPSLVEAVETNGMEAVTTSGDVDVRLSVDAVELALKGYDIVVATRDADFKPALEKANQVGAKTTVVGIDEGFSAALESVADEVVFLDL
ncbi:MAG: NYN domain-containing protein [Halobacteria archaeon]|nr:NYN domain-containing protein [Halobacteria archaeon]